MNATLHRLTRPISPDDRSRVTVAQCHADLRDTFIKDFLAGSTARNVPTPAWAGKRALSTVDDVLLSLMDDDRTILANARLVIAAAAAGVECQTFAQMLLSLVSERYAAEHADDAAADEEARLL
jgi:hypothetical protein